MTYADNHYNCRKKKIPPSSEKIDSVLSRIVSRLENGSVSVIKQDNVVIQINLNERNVPFDTDEM